MDRGDAAENPAQEKPRCWLCQRPLGRRIEYHHPLPKSQKGRETVAVHPVCHRTIHAVLSNRELARHYVEAEALRAHPDIARFLRWIASKPPDFHVRTHKTRRS